MRKIRELFRLKAKGRSQRQIASSLSVATGTVNGQLRRAREAGITWERAQAVTDTELEALLFETADATWERRARRSTTAAFTVSCTDPA